MIRSSFELFRLDPLRKLELDRPNNSIEEFETWQNINELIVLGSHSLTFTKIDYRQEEQQAMTHGFCATTLSAGVGFIAK